MEDKTFNEAQFNNYILRLIKDYQEGEMTDYKRGAVSALVQISDQFQKMTVENGFADKPMNRD
ncbi:hypothetical protein D922_04008 [Enterococcus faecalis 06-MB-DW-09]|nr:hypothetical protein D922_04008 [Enterococcus faecalis 06-MB-DW-09]